MSKPKIALIVLNRNLPSPTNALCQRFLKFEDSAVFDLYVIEAGSDSDRLSDYCSWHVTDPDVVSQGFRACRGFNFGLKKLYDEGRFLEYDYFFLVTNDSVFANEPILPTLIEEMDRHRWLGLLSPCSRRWGELDLLQGEPTRYFWHVQNTAYFIRRGFVEALMNPTDQRRFFFDGENFRGYLAETELIAKGYANDWASGITRRVFVEENESHLLENSEKIRTDSYERNLALYIEEGCLWLKEKYGFTSRWQMQMYARFWYDQFFQYHPECELYRI